MFNKFQCCSVACSLTCTAQACCRCHRTNALKQNLALFLKTSKTRSRNCTCITDPVGHAVSCHCHLPLTQTEWNCLAALHCIVTRTHPIWHTIWCTIWYALRDPKPCSHTQWHIILHAIWHAHHDDDRQPQPISHSNIHTFTIDLPFG